MAPPETPAGGDEHGQGLLATVSNEMVRAQKKYFGKGPVKAKTYMMDDLLICVMRGGLTIAEKTMLEFGKEDLVRNFRQEFENDMTDRLVGLIEELTNRKVVTYQSQIMFEPDLIVEMFVFDSPVAEDVQTATAEGLLDEDEAGGATDAEALGGGPS